MFSSNFQKTFDVKHEVDKYSFRLRKYTANQILLRLKSIYEKFLPDE